MEDMERAEQDRVRKIKDLLDFYLRGGIIK